MAMLMVLGVAAAVLVIATGALGHLGGVVVGVVVAVGGGVGVVVETGTVMEVDAPKFLEIEVEENQQLGRTLAAAIERRRKE